MWHRARSIFVFPLLAGCATAPTVGPDAAKTDGTAPTTTGTVDTLASDDDGDGWSVRDGDCDDADPTAHPGAAEVWYDGVDEACDGGDDFDQDADGYDVDLDCDDTDAGVHPGVDERENGVDDDCDGAVDEGTGVSDDDGDGYTEAEGDCDDADASRSPGASEVCDGAVDEDCDGAVDEASDVVGSAFACPAVSCLDVKERRPDARDGAYWIEVGGVTREMVCDMTRDYGGWTLVANFVWPGNTGGVAGWTSGAAVGSSMMDRGTSFKVGDADINDLVTVRYRGRGTASYCTLDGGGTGACAVDTTLYWDSACVYASGTSSTGACTAAYQTYSLDGWTELSNPCSWHYGLTSADCGVTSEFGSSHDGDHVFVGILGTYTHGYDGRDNEDPNVEVWVR